MKISFFKNGYIALNEDHTYIKPVTKDGVTEPAKGHPDCIFCREIDFDPSKQTIDFDPISEEIAITNIPEDKHARIYQSLISAESIDGFDLEGEIFTDFEIGEIITARVFDGNPHAEKALTNKVLAVTIALLQGDEMTEGMAGKITEAQTKKSEVDAVRNLFNLGNL